MSLDKARKFARKSINSSNPEAVTVGSLVKVLLEQGDSSAAVVESLKGVVEHAQEGIKEIEQTEPDNEASAA